MDVDTLRYRFEDGQNDKLIKISEVRLGIRHLQLVYMALCSAAAGALRASGPVALLAMADSARSNGTALQMGEWDGRRQGTALAAFFLGYAAMVVPAELALKRLGGKALLGAALVANGALAAALPTVARRGGWIAVCNAEFILGMSQSCIAPAHEVMLDRWLPPKERSLFSCVVYGGFLVGIVLGLPAAGALSTARRGGEMVFYSQAMAALSVAAMWLLLTAGSPDRHQAIGDKEKEYIQESQSQTQTGARGDRGARGERGERGPWRRVLASPRLWALAAAHAAANALYVFFLAEVPAYLAAAFRVSLRDACYISALPFISMWLIYITTAPSINWAYKTDCISYIMSLTNFRKIINTLGAAGVVTGLVTLYYLNSVSRHLAVVMLVGTLGMLGFQLSGFLENHADISENFPKTVLIASNVFASLAGALVPLACGLLLGDDPNDITRWQNILLCLMSFYIVCNLVYTALGSTKKQDWEYTIIDQKHNGYQNRIHNFELEE